MNNLIGKNLTAGYGGVDIIKDINLEVNEGEIVVIVGPNGAGKSTAMKALLGMLSLTSGSVEYSNEEISSMLPQNRINLGLAFVPQTNNVFTGMTVEENLEMGGFLRDDDIIHDKVGTLSKVLKKVGVGRNKSLSYPSWNGEELEEVYPWGTVRIPTEEVNIKTAKELSKSEILEIYDRTQEYIKTFKYDDIYNKIK